MKHGTDNYLSLLRRYCFLKEKWTRTGPYRDALVALVQFIQDSLNLSSLPLSNPSCVRRWTIIHGSHRHLIHRLCSFEYQICNVKKNLNSISTRSSGRNVATEQVTHFSSKKMKKKNDAIPWLQHSFYILFEVSSNWTALISRTPICWQAESLRTYLSSYFNIYRFCPD